MKKQLHNLLAILPHYQMGKSSEHFFSTVQKCILFWNIFIAKLEAALALRAILLDTMVYQKIAENTYDSKGHSSNGS